MASQVFSEGDLRQAVYRSATIAFSEIAERLGDLDTNPRHWLTQGEPWRVRCQLRIANIHHGPLRLAFCLGSGHHED